MRTLSPPPLVYLITGAIATLSLVADPSYADYRPPAGGDTVVGPTTAGGRRGGCTGEADLDLMALAPQSHVGQTMATHPTLAWYVPDAEPYPLTLRLYHYRTGSLPELVQTYPLPQSQPGFMEFTLPATEPSLTVGETYLWQVVQTCEPGRPSSNLAIAANFRVVPTPAALDGVDLPADPAAQAQLLAAAGLWYDAAAIAFKAPATAATRRYRAVLLNDLASLEAASAPEAVPSLSDQLQQLAAMEQP